MRAPAHAQAVFAALGRPAHAISRPPRGGDPPRSS
ncbi:hypothetical protein SCE1572_39240 [Sorangium cellulosum So0157-2]|uniref:Uncharacterized protein n=1 Tax=Sorangium cellulosum So0157-2 TaxID=1254432 RepID=S4Y6D7_SORCE|nr:hypothetical protein SCE1572_39240 [Sorangium cellulosum So0157-2]